MVETELLPIFKFRTADYPEADRFHVWVKDNLCDCRFDDDGYGPFDAEATGAALGPLVIACRHWPARSRPLAYLVHRSPGRSRRNAQTGASVGTFTFSAALVFLVVGFFAAVFLTACFTTAFFTVAAFGALQRQRIYTQMNGGRVFQDPRYNEDWKNEEAFPRVFWARMPKRLGIRYRRPHNMRHSYATAMLMAGMTPRLRQAAGTQRRSVSHHIFQVNRR